MSKRGFRTETCQKNDIIRWEERALQCRGDILTMTSVAGSGHPGGSLSSIDFLTLLYDQMSHFPDRPCSEERDYLLISNGHISPALYAVLGRSGYFPYEEALEGFRKAGTPYEGHVDTKVPGVEWITGNLGQGLSAAAGIAIGLKFQKKDNHVFCVMGDGEQQKGQIAETRRFASKFRLDNLTVIIDYNRLQISGDVDTVMKVDLVDEYRASGWDVIEIDGHDFRQIYRALYQAIHEKNNPVMILAGTVMGKGVSFMENDEKWHGQALGEEQLHKALQELGVEDRYEEMKKKRADRPLNPCSKVKKSYGAFQPGERIEYEASLKTDNRSAFGKALESLGEANPEKIVVLDCDLAGSVKTGGFAQKWPGSFFQAGIQEHSTASIAGGISATGLLTFWADFGVFAADEVYNQLRLNDINQTNLKIAATHCGLNVGEDGKTHHAINYIGLLRCLYGFHLLTPADPNQTDAMVRYAAARDGNYFLAMGRAKTPVITDDKGQPRFGRDYHFTYGQLDHIRTGGGVTVFTYGALLPYALEAWNRMKGEGKPFTLINVTSPLAPDREGIRKAAEQSDSFIVYEDHNIHTGFGALLADIMAEEGIHRPLVKLGVKEYARSGAADDVYRLAGLATEDLQKAVEEQR
jgi:transketolase